VEKLIYLFISDLVHKFTYSVEALGSEVGADAIPGHDDSRFSTAAVAILRTELAFYAVKRIQLCKWTQSSAVSGDNTEGILGVAPMDCIEAISVLGSLTTIAHSIQHTSIPLIKQVRFSIPPHPPPNAHVDTIYV